MQSPSKIAGTDFFKSTSNKEATKEPVHAPVPGSGIPTNKTSPQNSYRFIWSLFPIALLSSFSISGQNNFVFFNHLKICLMKSRINGIGIKFPIIQITIACVIGIFKSVAKSSPPRSSRIGTIETKKTAGRSIVPNAGRVDCLVKTLCGGTFSNGCSVWGDDRYIQRLDSLADYQKDIGQTSCRN